MSSNCGRDYAARNIDSEGFRTYLERQGVVASMEYPEVSVTGLSRTGAASPKR